jgi:hypothetical protein
MDVIQHQDVFMAPKITVRKPPILTPPTRAPEDRTPARVRQDRGFTNDENGPVAKVPRAASTHESVPVAADGEPLQASVSVAPAIIVTDLPVADGAQIRSSMMPLERYQLTPPALLQPADAQGFRALGRRHYVDLAQGGIALVRQDPLTGVYRAALASELGLGPTLFLDRGSMTWRHAVHFNENLKARLDSIKDSRKRFDFVTNNMRSEIGTYSIVTRYKDDSFTNEFQPDTWTFMGNYRTPSNTDYYANDIVRYQYTRIANKEHFFGCLPSTIVRSYVSNKAILKKTNNLESGSDEMLNVFLNETQNGRSTQRILNDFGLIATKVEVRVDEDNVTDYLIKVMPDLSS